MLIIIKTTFDGNIPTGGCRLHILTSLYCLASGYEEKLNRIFNKTRREETRSFTCTLSSSQNINYRNKCMSSYLRMRVLKSRTLSDIKVSEFRSFS